MIKGLIMTLERRGLCAQSYGCVCVCVCPPLLAPPTHKDKIKDPNRVTWEDFKKENKDKVRVFMLYLSYQHYTGDDVMVAIAFAYLLLLL